MVELLSSGLNLPLPLAVLLVGGLLSLVVGKLAEWMKIRRLREAWMVLVSAAGLFSVWMLYQRVQAVSVVVMALWGQNPPLGGCFEIDMLSVFMAGSISLIGLLVAVYSVSYMEKEDASSWRGTFSHCSSSGS
jgi:NADH:ubiquinone oxidoreductase subunit 5 (subunit L)/multisubunit Na+/H+ antiporter MnhA subunit